jgi:hypothetical protein
MASKPKDYWGRSVFTNFNIPILSWPDRLPHVMRSPQKVEVPVTRLPCKKCLAKHNLIQSHYANKLRYNNKCNYVIIYNQVNKTDHLQFFKRKLYCHRCPSGADTILSCKDWKREVVLGWVKPGPQEKKIRTPLLGFPFKFRFVQSTILWHDSQQRSWVHTRKSMVWPAGVVS